MVKIKTRNGFHFSLDDTAVAGLKKLVSALPSSLPDEVRVPALIGIRREDHSEAFGFGGHALRDIQNSNDVVDEFFVDDIRVFIVLNRKKYRSLQNATLAIRDGELRIIA